VKINKVYFFCVIEGDLMICASISKILKIKFNDIETTLLLPDHPRIRGDKMKFYYQFFDCVINLPYCTFSKDIFSGMKKGLKFKKIINKFVFAKNSIIFMFDIFTLPDLIIYHRIQQLRRNKIIKLGIITPFISSQFDHDKLSVIIKDTLINTIYSIFLAGGKILKSNNIKSTKFKNKVLKQYADVVLAIEKSNIRTEGESVYKNMLYPVPAIDYKQKSDIELKFSKSILILISSIHGKRWNNYWVKVQKILSEISKIKGFNLLIKDHPGTISLAKKYLNNFNFILLDNKLNAEQIYLNKKLNIQTVVGYGSTALLTASWMGLQTVDYTKLLGYPKATLQYYNNFLKIGKSIVKLDNLDELKNIDFGKSVKGTSVNEILDQWTIIMDRIIN